MDVAKKAVKLVQVKAEPGLTTAEMMLTNDDLRPGSSRCCVPTMCFLLT